ncbi:MAG TPA: hypothetical protein PLH56_00640 [Candidatus Omnitrophota bacterium]|nr:hypothetical protein [Candidatus Omnitrophota bacterium]HPN87830.1 hypothetical protein [Candidatus Omnitrophota bacterium]
MKEENIKMLQNLSTTAYRSGFLPVFLGLLVVFVSVIYGKISEVPIGILIFFLGYTFIKISQKINSVLDAEMNIENKSA